jgi:hypothetical protein
MFLVKKRIARGARRRRKRGKSAAACSDRIYSHLCAMQHSVSRRKYLAPFRPLASLTYAFKEDDDGCEP